MIFIFLDDSYIDQIEISDKIKIEWVMKASLSCKGEVNT